MTARMAKFEGFQKIRRMEKLKKERIIQKPEYLKDVNIDSDFNKWILKTAERFRRRDKKRFKRNNWKIWKKEDYKNKIIAAFNDCKEGNDYYTGKKLNWTLLDKYGKKNGYVYDKNIKSEVPTFDHVFENDNGKFHFVICSWLVNDMINDQKINDVIKLCKIIDENLNKTKNC